MRASRRSSKERCQTYSEVQVVRWCSLSTTRSRNTSEAISDKVVSIRPVSLQCPAAATIPSYWIEWSRITLDPSVHLPAGHRAYRSFLSSFGSLLRCAVNVTHLCEWNLLSSVLNCNVFQCWLLWLRWPDSRNDWLWFHGFPWPGFILEQQPKEHYISSSVCGYGVIHASTI